MTHAHFRFYGNLNDFLPLIRRGVMFTHTFQGRVSIKDMIEALGVPHPELDLIVVNREPVGFSYLVREGDQISVYPFFKSIDISSLLRVRPAPLPTPRFILDSHLGRLTRYLRLLGFDTRYRIDFPDRELAQLAGIEQRILLTRDRALLKRSIVTHGYCLRETDPRRQIVEVVRRFDLGEAVKPFRRCIRCNGLLKPVSKDAIYHRLEPDTRQYYDEFIICQTCQHIYWRGTHYERLQRFVQSVLRAAGSAVVS